MIHKIIELKKINYEDSIGINKKGVWIEKHFEKIKYIISLYIICFFYLS